MAKFRKKPVVVEAEQYDRGRPCPEGICFCDFSPMTGDAHIHTLEGPLLVSHRDWIITGVRGEKYPCRPDIFEQTYEAVEEINTRLKGADRGEE